MFVELLVWNVLRTRPAGTSSPIIHAQNHLFLHNCFFLKFHWKFHTRASSCSLALTILRHHIMSSLRIAVALLSLPQWLPCVFTSNHGDVTCNYPLMNSLALTCNWPIVWQSHARRNLIGHYRNPGMKRHRARNLLVGDQTLFAVGGDKGLGTRL